MRFQKTLYDFIKILLSKIDYIEYLKKKDDMVAQTKIDNVLEFIRAIEDYEHLNPTKGLIDFLYETSLISEIDTYKESTQKVTLMTLHSAKGLEFPVVFIVGMEEEILPYKLVLIEGNRSIEEERRLLYVGMTRAMKKLYFTRAVERYIYGKYQSNPPSRFLSEIPQNLIHIDDSPFYFSEFNIYSDSFQKAKKLLKKPKKEKKIVVNEIDNESFPIGTEVIHPKFGVGKVLFSQKIGQDFKVIVSFLRVGRKVLYAKRAKLKKVL